MSVLSASHPTFSCVICLCSQESYIRHLTSEYIIRVYVSHDAIQIEGALLYYTIMIHLHYFVSLTKKIIDIF